MAVDPVDQLQPALIGHFNIAQEHIHRLLLQQLNGLHIAIGLKDLTIGQHLPVHTVHNALNGKIFIIHDH